MRLGPDFTAASAAPIVLNARLRCPALAVWSSPFGDTKRAIFSFKQGLSFGGSIELQLASTSDPSRPMSAGAFVSRVVTSAPSSEGLGAPSIWPSGPASGLGIGCGHVARSSQLTSVGAHPPTSDARGTTATTTKPKPITLCIVILQHSQV